MFIYLFHKCGHFEYFESESNRIKTRSISVGLLLSPDIGAQIMLGYLLFCQLLIYEVVLTL